ncbi:MAG: class I SAM-dependent methyltransferase [Candidatus Margulisiibacteriota bacterium]
MDERFPAFRALTETDLQNDTVRADGAALKKLNQAGLMWKSSKDMDTEWERIKFISENAAGDVLEIGCATGLVTKYLSANHKVRSIHCVDTAPICIKYLKSLGLCKVNANIFDLTTEKLNGGEMFGCVVMAELIEHLSAADEMSIIKNIYKNINDGETVFIITTPVGYMPDPSHVRGFSKEMCAKHIFLHYGDIINKRIIADTYQCYAVRFKKRAG